MGYCFQVELFDESTKMGLMLYKRNPRDLGLPAWGVAVKALSRKLALTKHQIVQLLGLDLASL